LSNNFVNSHKYSILQIILTKQNQRRYAMQFKSAVFQFELKKSRNNANYFVEFLLYNAYKPAIKTLDSKYEIYCVSKGAGWRR